MTLNVQRTPQGLYMWNSTVNPRTSRWRYLLLFIIVCACLTCDLHAAPVFKFVQITDLHLYDKGDEGAENRTALIDCIAEINYLISRGQTYEFAVVTGDIGLEGMLKDLRDEEIRLQNRETELTKNENLSAQELNEQLGTLRFNLSSIRLQIDNRITAGAMDLASLLEVSGIKEWLFLPGNNDLIDEDVGTLYLYRQFIKELGRQLQKKNKTVVDLCPYEDDQKSGLFTKNGYVFIGFNDASFKNNDDPKRIILKDTPITPEALSKRISTTERTDRSVVGTQQEKYVNQVLERVNRDSAGSVYIFYHIPEVDDSHIVIKLDFKALNNRMLSASEPYAFSAWFVEGKVRNLWHDVVKQPQVKALFAGHFHDWRHTTYEKYDWMRTPTDLYPSLPKLYICPPLAIKRQADAVEQARGFQVVTIVDAQIINVQRRWYLNNTHTFSPIYGTDLRTEVEGMKFEQFVALIGYIAWPIVAIGVLLVLRKELKEIFGSLGKKIADPGTQLSIGDWLTIKSTVTANAGKLESLDLGLQNLGLQVVTRAGTAADTAATQPSAEDQATLNNLAQEYLTFREDDYAARVRRKNELATKMGNFILQHGIPRAWIAVRKNEGLTVGLASAVNAVPSEGDLDLLLAASEGVTKLHVRYRIVVALGRLFELRLATTADVERTNAVLNSFKQDDDASLKRRIEQTETIIKLAVKTPPPAS